MDDFDQLLVGTPVPTTKPKTKKQPTGAAAATSKQAPKKKTLKEEVESAKPLPKPAATTSKHQQPKLSKQQSQPLIAAAVEPDQQNYAASNSDNSNNETTGSKRSRKPPQEYWIQKDGLSGHAVVTKLVSATTEASEPAAKKARKSDANEDKKKKELVGEKGVKKDVKSKETGKGKGKEKQVFDDYVEEDGEDDEKEEQAEESRSETKSVDKAVPKHVEKVVKEKEPVVEGKKKPQLQRKNSVTPAVIVKKSDMNVDTVIKEPYKKVAPKKDAPTYVSDSESERDEASETPVEPVVVSVVKKASKSSPSVASGTSSKPITKATSSSALSSNTTANFTEREPSPELTTYKMKEMPRPRTIDEINDAAGNIPMKDALKKIGEMKAELEKYKAQRETKQERLLREYQEASKKHVAALQKQVQDLEFAYEACQTREKEYKKTETQQEFQIKENETNLTDLRSRLETLQASSSSASLEAFQKEVEGLREQNAGLVMERNGYVAELGKEKKETERLKKVVKEKDGLVVEGGKKLDAALEQIENSEKKLKVALEETENSGKELEAALAKVDGLEKESKALVSEVKSLRAKLQSLEQRAVAVSDGDDQQSNPTNQPSRSTQTLERMVKMYEELTRFKIQSVEETRVEIDSDDEESEEDEEEETRQDEIDRARRRSVRRQSVGVLKKQRSPRLEDVLEHRCEQSGLRGVLHFSLTLPKEQTPTASPNILYTLHTAKNDEGEVIDEDDEELPDYLNGEMTFPRERLIDFFRKTCGWLYSKNE
ncbi:UNVERIFIED_CONTAM: hypothetical protein HDU68_007781 [Siphonaria sp. JEL0065]|nr:hypothetical protein HDU68_007781 [Siphonaria sp. JEL0065]